MPEYAVQKPSVKPVPVPSSCVQFCQYRILDEAIVLAYSVATCWLGIMAGHSKY